MEFVSLQQTEVKTDYPEDRQIARRCALGDERALRELYVLHEPRLRKLAIRNVGSREDAEEIVATTFIRFWRAAGRYRGSCSLKSYLTRIALNLCYDVGKKRKPVFIHVGTLEPDESPFTETIRMGMLKLDREDRELLSLYYLDEWDYNEICDSLGITYDVLKTRLVRARKRLRIIVEELK